MVGMLLLPTLVPPRHVCKDPGCCEQPGEVRAFKFARDKRNSEETEDSAPSAAMCVSPTRALGCPGSTHPKRDSNMGIDAFACRSLWNPQFALWKSFLKSERGLW
jgi:hypothetical protein